jgi:2-amino-4-hydroxy-6-hydroxymethyldihydropteridine diphosphokinase
MHLVVLGFGSNLGNRQQTILSAYSLLEERLKTVLKKSSFYETEPWGNLNQPKFINSAAYLTTDKTPFDVLEVVLDIETYLGRVRKEKWGARIIDIDILFFGNRIINSNNLIIPHPYIQERRFVMQPLAEILPNYVHPVLNKDIKTLLMELK